MSVYLDTSLLVSFFTVDALSEKADAFFGTVTDEIIVSDFAVTEFASAVARRARTGRLDRSEATEVFADFDVWIARVAGRMETQPVDVVAAGAYLRRLDLNLRAPDAIHIAIASRIGARLATFDQAMLENAQALGVAIADL